MGIQTNAVMAKKQSIVSCGSYEMEKEAEDINKVETRIWKYFARLFDCIQAFKITWYLSTVEIGDILVFLI